ncbi:dCTP deaminase [Sphingomicrobium marinum]|uniref:dCTP deaminase n=1 Tax=Sphingomicrobium marinum TaxID=1227950 RepID=UPI00223F643D|nr:dCTP deaminase [Sphingomicrobium marinum]
MLSVGGIKDRIDGKNGAKLSIIPQPPASEFEERHATSVDFRLGRWFRSFKHTHTPSCDLSPPPEGDASTKALPTKEHFIPFGKKFVVHPNTFVLGATLEWLSLPKDISGYVTGKSTLGRHGLIIETAAGVHPGFSGCLTLELANVGEIPLEIWPGMKICQVFFHDIESDAEIDRSVASGFRKPALPMQKADKLFHRLRVES